MSSFVIGLILILVGISALLGIMLFKLIFAIIVIVIGVKLLTRSGRSDHFNWSKQMSSSSEEYVDEVSIFSPINKHINSENFRGGKIVMIFSGGQLDLRDAHTREKEIILEIVGVFSGLKIIIPKNWKVSREGTAIFGGYDNKTEDYNGDVTLKIKGSVNFAGVEIIN